MAETETGWTKEFPQVDGCYWVRQPPHTPYLIEITDGFAAFFGVERMVEASSFKSDHEFAPASPSDFEQLTRLRRIAELTLKVLDDADYGLDVYSLAPNLRSAAKALREALTQRAAGGEL